MPSIYRPRHLCSWCDTIATIATNTDESRCSACDRRWFPRDLVADLTAAFLAVGVATEVVGMGGGCEALRVACQRADGRFMYISDGDAARPTTRGIHAAWLDEDSDEWSDDNVLHVDVDDYHAWNVETAIATIVAAVVA